MILGSFTQTPYERLDYDIYFGDFFPSGDSVNTQVTTADTGLTVSASINTAKDTVKVYASGGNAGSRYKVKVLATSVQGRIKEGEFWVNIKED